MILSSRSLYGVRAMYVLADRYGQGLTQTAEIAARNGVSLHYLEQLLYSLGHARLVVSKRGKNGGFGLAHSPDNITVLDIVEALDGSLTLTSCPTGSECCRNPVRCAWHDMCNEACDALRFNLKQVSLTQLLEQQRQKQAAYPVSHRHPNQGLVQAQTAFQIKKEHKNE